MHLETRITYEPYVYRSPDQTQQLTDEDKLEHVGLQKARHVSALFFLLRHIDLRFEFIDEEATNMQLRNIGDLGVAISEGVFGDIDEAIETLKKVTTFE